MKRLFIYYSNTGNGDAAASYLREAGVEMRKVTPKKDLPSSFFMKIMKGGFLAGLGHKSKLKDFDADVGEYDEVIVCSPIWNGRLSCPVNAVLSAVDFSGKKPVFVLYAASGRADKAVEKLSKLFPDSKVVILKEPKKYPEELKKLDLFK